MNESNKPNQELSSSIGTSDTSLFSPIALIYARVGVSFSGRYMHHPQKRIYVSVRPNSVTREIQERSVAYLRLSLNDHGHISQPHLQCDVSLYFLVGLAMTHFIGTTIGRKGRKVSECTRHGDGNFVGGRFGCPLGSYLSFMSIAKVLFIII